VSFNLGEGSSSLALYEREAAAQDAGVSSEGSGFRGVSFHFIVQSSDAVDEVMGHAVAAGGGVVKEAQPLSGGTSGTSAIRTATPGRSPPPRNERSSPRVGRRGGRSPGRLAQLHEITEVAVITHLDLGVLLLHSTDRR